MSISVKLLQVACRKYVNQSLLTAVNQNNFVARRDYREIVHEQEGKVTKIKGVLHETEGVSVAEKNSQLDTCPLRSRGIQITYEDVLILRQFMSDSGRIYPRSVTGLCEREFYKVVSCIKQAQRANMLPGEAESDTTDWKGVEVPKLNRYLTRYDVGSRTPVRSRTVWYTKMPYKVGDRRVVQDAPRVGHKRMSDSH